MIFELSARTYATAAEMRAAYSSIRTRLCRPAVEHRLPPLPSPEPEQTQPDKRYDAHILAWLRFQGLSFTGPAHRHILARSRELGFSYAELVGPSQKRDLALARQILWVEIRDTFGKSFPEIGAIFNRDHTTVLYGYRKVLAMRERGEL